MYSQGHGRLISLLLLRINTSLLPNQHFMRPSFFPPKRQVVLNDVLDSLTGEGGGVMVMIIFGYFATFLSKTALIVV